VSAPPAPISGLFLAGTDTAVGKTTLGAAVLRLALRAGRRPVPFKPAETGCDPLPQDALRLLAASSRPDLTVADVCPYPFRPPVAPAAAAIDRPLQLSDLLVHARALASRGDLLLVEAAGGLLSPYALDFTGADLAAALGLPILLVSRNGLGTVNHTALAVSELRRRRLPLAGLVLMTVSPHPTPDQPLNARLIQAVCGVRPLAVLPHFAEPDPDALADHLAGQVPPAELASCLGL
jgi:dethiobiotin synthetase